MAFVHDGFWGRELVGSAWMAWIYLRCADLAGNDGVREKGYPVFSVQHPSQAVFYIPAILLLGIRGFQVCSFMRRQRSFSQYRRIRMGRDLLLLIILLLCLLPGIICECYINPLLLKAYF